MINLFFNNNISNNASLNLIFEGDSITLGNHVGVNEDYPYLTFSTYFDDGNNAYANIGAGSDTAANIDSTKANIVAQFDENYLNVVILLIGINDIAIGAETNTQIYQHIKNIWAYIKSNGGIMVAGTILPAGSVSGWETSRSEINNWIRNDNHLYDYLVDFGADADIGVSGSQNDTAYYLSDKVHPNVNGNTIMASIVRNALINFN